MQLTKATRRKVKLKIGLAGVSGGGKTYSALLLAKGLAGSFDKVAVIDTENGSADLYAHLGDYSTLTLDAPFSPEKYIEAIKMCEDAGVEVIVIDSMTHEWAGSGGCLEIQEKLGGRYQDWAKVKPRHRKFLDTILASPCHVITTVRSKQDYAMNVENGKSRVTKLGMKQVTEEGFEYELTLSFDVSLNHLASTSKDRTGMFTDKPEFMITEKTGEQLADWGSKGIDAPVEPKEPIEPTVEAQKGIKRYMDTIPGKTKSKQYYATAKEAGIEAMKAKAMVKEQFKLESYNDVEEKQLQAMINAVKKKVDSVAVETEVIDEIFDGIDV